MQRRERCLCRGDTPQIVAADVVCVVGELRQLSGDGQRLSGDQRRRTNLFICIGVAVERVLTQRARHGGPEPALHREHRAGNLDRALGIEDAQCCSRLPVRHALVVSESLGHLQRAAYHLVVVAARTVAHLRMRQVGDAQQQVAQHRLDFGVLGIERLLPLAERTAFCHQRLGIFLVATELADLLGEFVDSRSCGIALGHDVAKANIEAYCVFEMLEQFGFRATCESGANCVGLRAQQPDINHNHQG